MKHEGNLPSICAMTAALWIATGCGAATDIPEGAASETVTQDLSASAWRTWDSSKFVVSSLYPNRTKFSMEPALCANLPGTFVVGVLAEDQRYYLRAYDNGLTIWKKFGEKQ